MRIPKVVKLLGRTWKVKFLAALMYQAERMGEICYREQEIHLLANSQAAPVPREMTEQTFFHELTHMVLRTMGEEELDENEKFVDLMGSMWYALLKESGMLKDKEREAPCNSGAF